MSPWVTGQISVLNAYVPPMFVAQNVVNTGYTVPLTSMALPAGTQIGDLLTLSMIGGFGDGLASTSDSRMTVLDTTDINSRHSCVAVGYASTLDDLQIQLKGNQNAYGQFNHAQVVAWRGEDGRQLNWDPTRLSQKHDYQMAPATVPGLPKAGSGAIAVYQTVAAVSGVKSPDWSRPGIYEPMAVANMSYNYASQAVTLRHQVPEVPTPHITDGSWSYNWNLIGLK